MGYWKVIHLQNINLVILLLIRKYNPSYDQYNNFVKSDIIMLAILLILKIIQHFKTLDLHVLIISDIKDWKFQKIVKKKIKKNNNKNVFRSCMH